MARNESEGSVCGVSGCPRPKSLESAHDPKSASSNMWKQAKFDDLDVATGR